MELRRGFPLGVIFGMLLFFCLGLSLRTDIDGVLRLTAKSGVFSDSLTTNGTMSVGGCLIGNTKALVRDSLRVPSIYVGGQIINKILRASATLDFDLSAVTCQDLTITVTGAALNDEVFVGAPNGSIVTDETVTAWVSAANTVTIRACDGALAGNPASGTYKVTVFK